MKKSKTIFNIILTFSLIIIFGSSYTFNHESKIENQNLNKMISLQNMNKQKMLISKKSGFNVLSTFNGTITGYSADCKGCSGNLACTGTNVNKNGIYYNDTKYKNVRIVATSSKYPCGTIIRFNLPTVSDKPIIAIALDRGVNGDVVDLLVQKREDAINFVGYKTNQKIEILRLGW